MKKPGRFTSSILDRLVPRHIGRSGLGDYNELYDLLFREKGSFRANLWCWLQITKLFPVFLLQSTHRSMIMFKNYLKIAFRSLKNNIVYSTINIFGLAIGIACSVVILFYITDESGYDTYHENAENLYRLTGAGTLLSSEQWRYSALSSLLWGPQLKADYPEVEEFARFSRPNNDWEFSVGDIKADEDNIFYADASVFTMFSWPLLHGDPTTVLDKGRTIVISESAAQKYFSRTDVVGETIHIDPKQTGDNGRRIYNAIPHTITGVMKDIPKKSHFTTDFILSVVDLNAVYGGDMITNSGFHVWFWRGNIFYTYLKLKEGYNPEDLEEKFTEFQKTYPIDSETIARGFKVRMGLQNVRDIHYSTTFTGEPAPTTNTTALSMFSIVAIFILFIACINFTNLSTARSMYRAREVGLRKVVGAERVQLIRQFLGESLFTSLFALFVGVGIVAIILPRFYEYTGKELIIGLPEIMAVAPMVLGLTVLVGILAGSYPAFFVSAFRPISVLKNKIRSASHASSYLRRGLVITQFGISIVLIISTLTVFSQLGYMKNKELGFNKDQVLVIPPSLGRALTNSLESFRAELTQNPNIVSVSGSSAIPGRLATADVYGVDNQAADGSISITEFWVDENFLELYDLRLLAGRNFSKEISTDYTGLEGRENAGSAFIINESAVRGFGWASPEEALGKVLVRDPNSRDYTGTVVGVIQDFHIASLRRSINPMMLHVNNMQRNYISVRLSTENVAETIDFIREKATSFEPNIPFDYSFVDDDFNRAYQQEQRMGEIFGYVASLAVLIACMGLFGLASFTAESRAKEIGIRKVLGASTSKIVSILSKEFTILVLIANVISWPIAYYVMSSWLEGFAFRITMGIDIFLLSAIIALVIAILTVGMRTLVAAMSNPVNSLRYE